MAIQSNDVDQPTTGNGHYEKRPLKNVSLQVLCTVKQPDSSSSLKIDFSFNRFFSISQ